tara:strand:- start:1700 stop:3412 length:1713 start_codon:yes stop_codon:yes gene_type:complete
MAYENFVPRDMIKKIGSPAVKSEMDQIFDAGGGDDAVWRYTPTGTGKWDGKTFGATAKDGKDPNLIIIKSSGAVIDKLINRYRNSYIHIRQGQLKGNKSKIGGYKKGEHIYLWVGIQPIKFEKTSKLTNSKGGAIHESTMTRMQELGSLWIFYQALNTSGWNNVEELKRDKPTYAKLADIWKKVGDADFAEDDSWLENFFEQQKVLLTKIGKSDNFTIFSRDGAPKGKNAYLIGAASEYKDTFMDWISGIVKKEPIRISSKDNWNPADIWLIRNEKKARELIKNAVVSKDPKEALEQLNSVMRLLFDWDNINSSQPKVFGISLKKIGSGSATIVPANHNETFFQSVENTQMEFDCALCKMDCKKDKDGRIVLSTQDTRFIVKDAANNTYDFQIKSNSSTGWGGLKYEPTASGATAARLGKATVELVEKLIKDTPGTGNFSTSKDSYAKDIKQFMNGRGSPHNDWKKSIKALVDEPKIGLKGIIPDNVQCNSSGSLSSYIVGGNDPEQIAYDNMLFVWSTTPHVVNSKLQQIAWLLAFLKLDKAARDKFATNMVFLAKKEGRRYGPFAKIS